MPAELPEGSVLLDVREDHEFTAGHAPEAVHVPLSAFQERTAEVPDADELYVICRSGGRSAQVAAHLNNQGRSAVNVSGGMQQWEALGRPMTSDSGETPAVV